MGWAFCGTDSEGRKIGYGIPATCDHPGCEKRIDRGLFYACGGMHGENEMGCERYFCMGHLVSPAVEDDVWEYIDERAHSMWFCAECAAEIQVWSETPEAREMAEDCTRRRALRGGAREQA